MKRREIFCRGLRRVSIACRCQHTQRGRHEVLLLEQEYQNLPANTSPSSLLLEDLRDLLHYHQSLASTNSFK